MKILEILLTNLANLFKVKTIISLIVIITLSYLSISNKIAAEAFTGIAGSVITFYFARKDDGK